MLRGGQPLDIERLRRPVDAARLALRAHIERANYCTRRARQPRFTRHSAVLGDFCMAPLGTPPSVTIGPVAPQLSSRRPRDVACAAAKMSPKAKATSKKPAPAPVDPKKAPPAKEPTGPIWEKKPKNFAIGGDIQVRSSSAPGKSSRGFCCIFDAPGQPGSGSELCSELLQLAAAPSPAQSNSIAHTRPSPVLFLFSRSRLLSSAATSSGRSTCASSGSARSCTSG